MRNCIFHEISFPEGIRDIPPETEKTQKTEEEIRDIITKAETNETAEAENIPNPEKVFADFGFSEGEFLKRSTEFYERPVSEVEETARPEFSELKKAYMDKSLYHWRRGSRVGPNCYAFILGLLRNPFTGECFDAKPWPGYFAGLKFSEREGYMKAIKEGDVKTAKENITRCIELDCRKLGRDFFEVDSKDYRPKENETLIAIAAAEGIKDACGDYIWPGADYHFYMKGNSGEWYHKPGMFAPRRLDNSFRRITDPEHCSRGDYNLFLGYYVIRDKEQEA